MKNAIRMSMAVSMLLAFSPVSANDRKVLPDEQIQPVDQEQETMFREREYQTETRGTTGAGGGEPESTLAPEIMEDYTHGHENDN